MACTVAHAISKQATWEIGQFAVSAARQSHVLFLGAAQGSGGYVTIDNVEPDGWIRVGFAAVGPHRGMFCGFQRLLFNDWFLRVMSVCEENQRDI
jgi:hypothetical protein